MRLAVVGWVCCISGIVTCVVGYLFLLNWVVWYCACAYGLNCACFCGFGRLAGCAGVWLVCGLVCCA